MEFLDQLNVAEGKWDYDYELWFGKNV